MGFVDYNTLGKFNAEVNTPLPTFSAESLLSLPSKQFSAATIDSTNVTNYDGLNFSRFSVGDDGAGSGSHTTNKNGRIRTNATKGFHFDVAPEAQIVSQVVTLSHDSTNANNKDFSFTLKPGDSLYRDGRIKNVVYVPADGSEKVTTEVPWIRGGSYNITLDAVTPIAPAGNGGANGANGDNGDNGDNGENGDDTEEEGTNWMLYGGAFALLAVGGFMAVKMMKKKK